MTRKLLPIPEALQGSTQALLKSAQTEIEQSHPGCLTHEHTAVVTYATATDAGVMPVYQSKYVQAPSAPGCGYSPSVGWSRAYAHGYDSIDWDN